jgi:hypothetical protein
VDERFDSFRSYGEESPESDEYEDKEVEVADCKICSLTAEERYDIIRKYNADYSIRRMAPNVIERAEQSEQNTISEMRGAEE